MAGQPRGEGHHVSLGHMSSTTKESSRPDVNHKCKYFMTQGR